MLLLAIAAELGVGCSARGPVRPPPPRAPPPERWAELPAARGFPRAAAPFVSSGHGGGHFAIEVRVSPASLDDYRALTAGRSLPAGTSVVAFHVQRETSEPGSIYVMEKSADGWRYLVADPSGVVAAKGQVAQCARCHDEARADHLFGLPASGQP